MKQMHLAAFLIAGNGAHSHALWRHPEATLEFLQPELYQSIAQILERGKFDLVFFADRLAVSDRYGLNLKVGVEFGDQDATRMDPIPILSLMSGCTSSIGLGATRSTTYHHPYHVARTFATLDHLSRGRAAWNVVTSMNDAEARNFGVDRHLEHGDRYDRADEFLQVCFKLWDSWEPDALQLNQKTGRYADPAKVHYIDHVGQWFQSKGPLNIPRSPQGRPVIIQAGSSGRGKEFAARWAEVIFTVQPDSASMKTFYQEVKSQLREVGRNPEHCKILPAVMPFIGDTEAEAREKQALHNDLVHPLVGLSTLSSHANYDFSQHALDEPLASIESRGTKGLLQAVRHLAQAEKLSLGEVGKLYGQSVLAPQIVGTPTQVADQLETLFRDRVCDGFVISPAYLPGTFAEFVDRVVPELQQRGIFRHDYAEGTLRDRLQLDTQ
ncbi:LLM class flavin-dependent oxidoreductase [Tumidithrix elongata RA019]|uniref:LLM class flavin-dependent oxidoreductase n=1 Tax=Tumidithrix elongata BACA0141 TaxID=2716417 RepID=A0AAW9PWZ3_9CYAN|nr:LLM class flavin-dependent oxidoreductase [Tumidithrix elongata RA019]